MRGSGRAAIWPGLMRSLRAPRARAAVVLVAFTALAGGAYSQVNQQAPGPQSGTQVASIAAQPAQEGLAAAPKRADFRGVNASAEARELAHWVVHSADNGPYSFIVVDKVQAQVFVFDQAGQLRGATSALVGAAVGDESVPGIGERRLSAIRPHERTTPAGRFMAYLDRDIHGEEVLWVDYDSALSLHRMPKGQPRERRAERLASPTPADNRITYGCINVPVAFYNTVVSPLLQKTQGVVYILPETRSARTVFGSYPVEEAPSPSGASAALAPEAPGTPAEAASVAR